MLNYKRIQHCKFTHNFLIKKHSNGKMEKALTEKTRPFQVSVNLGHQFKQGLGAEASKAHSLE